MRCNSCGIELPAGAAYCPSCSAATPGRISESGISPYDLTEASSPYSTPQQRQPSTDYGSPPYGIPQNPYEQNPYSSSNPYSVGIPAPPPPPRHRGRIVLIWGTLVLVFILISIGVFIAGRQSTTVQPQKQATQAIAPTTAPDNLTATAAASSVRIPYPPYQGILVLNEPLHDNDKDHNWQETNDTNGTCAFVGGAYHASTLKGGYFYPCIAQNTDLGNFVFEVQMTIIKGDCGALLFRIDSSNTNFYYFRICQDGTSELFVYRNNNG
jgi:hypothetical protein